MNAPGVIDGLHLSYAEYLALVESLDRPMANAATPNTRPPRLTYTPKQPLSLHLGDMPVRFLVRARNISREGIALLHSAFVYPNTACVVTLITLDGEQTCAPGIVVRCRCVHGRVHELGVKFHQPILLEAFVNVPRPRIPPPPPPSEARVDPAHPPSELATLALELQQLAARGAAPSTIAGVLSKIAALLAFGTEVVSGNAPPPDAIPQDAPAPDEAAPKPRAVPQPAKR